MTFKQLELGATGQFPDGRLDETDEGELSLAVGVDVEHNIRTPVVWLAMPAEQAIELGNQLIQSGNWVLDRRAKDKGGSDGG